MKPNLALRAAVAAFIMFLAACGNGGGGIAVPPPPATYYPRFGFVANQGDDTLSVYLINAATGQWLHHGYASTGTPPTNTSPIAVAVSANEKFVYVANDSGTVTGFKLDATSGRLEFVEHKMAGANPSALAVSLNSALLYVLNAGDNQIAGFSINATSGVLAAIVQPPTTVGTAPSALSIHPTRPLLYVANSGTGTVSGFSIDTTNGALTALIGSPYTVGTNPQDLTIDPSGQFLYVANEGSDNVTAFFIEPATSPTPGALTSPNTANAGDGPRSVTVAAGGKYAYAANYNTGTISIFSVDATSGDLTAAGTMSNPIAAPRSLRADPSGNFLFVTSETGQVQQGYSVNATNGALTALGVTRTRSQPVALAMSSSTGSLSPQPRYAYSVGSTVNLVRGYSVSATTGTLTRRSGYNTGLGPVALAVDPFNRFLYTANTLDDSITGFSINDTGALTQIDLDPLPGLPGDLDLLESAPQQLVVDPSGRFLYVSLTTTVAPGEVRAFSIATDGTLTAISGSPYPVGNDPKQLTIDPTGQYLYVVNQYSGQANGTISAFSINPVSGQLTGLGGAVNAGSEPQSVAIEPTGRFVYIGNRGVIDSGNTLTRYSITANGSLASSTTILTESGPADLATDPLGRFLYVAAAGLPGLAGYEIAATDGSLTAVGLAVATAFTPATMVIDPSGKFAYVGYSDNVNISVYDINATTGSLTAASSTAADDFPLSIALTRRLVSSSSPTGFWR